MPMPRVLSLINKWLFASHNLPMREMIIQQNMLMLDLIHNSFTEKIRLGFILNLLFVRTYIQTVSVKLDGVPFKIEHCKPLFLLAIMAFFIMASEGAIVDWSALYLKNISLWKRLLIFG